mmetsp:Transcript_47229/g.110073  ORF Transcript_47229/g.110073 Transcript_47229/m.110073 type:complete len:224 (+) Transcript_47229:407-1078(+)
MPVFTFFKARVSTFSEILATPNILAATSPAFIVKVASVPDKADGWKSTPISVKVAVTTAVALSSISACNAWNCFCSRIQASDGKVKLVAHMMGNTLAARSRQSTRAVSTCSVKMPLVHINKPFCVLAGILAPSGRTLATHSLCCIAGFKRSRKMNAVEVASTSDLSAMMTTCAPPSACSLVGSIVWFADDLCTNFLHKVCMVPSWSSCGRNIAGAACMDRSAS